MTPREPAASAPSRLTLMLLLDAFRPDYLAHAPYLRDLAARSETGVLRECFGFVPRAAYFGGLNAEQFGFTNMYCFDPAGSPFGLARFLPHFPGAAESGKPITARQQVELAAKARLPGFAKAYATSVQIPLHGLPFFDLVEKRAPWDRHVGYRSLFQILDEQRLPWLQCSWPETNRLPDHSDAGIVRQVLQDLKPEHRFAFVHLQELDGLGHMHGPGSAPVQAGIRNTDRLCQELIETLRQRYVEVNVVLFGDHGMVNVTRTLELSNPLAKTGLKFGADYVYFLDSTMARFWFFHKTAREVLTAALQNISGGRVLGPAKLEHYGIAGCDPRNAELYFLADPGVLIFPNFFQSQGEPIKGMHGYDPDCPDNLGLFLVSRANQDGANPTTLGKMDPPMLFPLLQELLGLAPAANIPARAAAAAAPAGAFTRVADPAADAVVTAHLQHILGAIEKQVGAVEAVVLTGSFGRGEGGVFRDAAGQYHPVNDYDLIVVDPQDRAQALQGLGDQLARELGIDFVDLGHSDGQWANAPLTIFNYDLKYGSRVIAGNASVLARLPAYAPADLPPYEPVKLLLNRMAGLLSGLNGDLLRGATPTDEQRRYLVNQTVKALLAVGDAWLANWQAYDSSYARRRQRFAFLAPGAGLSAELVAAVCRAYDFKCQPDYAQFGDALAEIRRLVPEMNCVLLRQLNRLTGANADALPQALQNYLHHQSADAAWVRQDNEHCLNHPKLAGRWAAHRPQNLSLRHFIYTLLPALLTAALESPEPPMAGLHSKITEVFALPPVEPAGLAAWEPARALVVEAWFAVCH